MYLVYILFKISQKNKKEAKDLVHKFRLLPLIKIGMAYLEPDFRLKQGFLFLQER